MMYLRKLIIGCVLVLAVHLPFAVNAQWLTVSGNGQLTVSAEKASLGYTIPKYKPNTKSITIIKHELSKDKRGNLVRPNYYDKIYDTILYDEQGHITNLNGFTFQYAGNRIAECSYRNGVIVYKYNSKGYLESAIDGMWTHKYNVDNKGNITRDDLYLDSKKWSERSMSYDTKGRIITYSTVDWDYSFCYNKEGQLVSCRKINYDLNFGKRGEKSKEIEDRFEYGDDGNLVHTIRYILGDISIINSGLEYEYVYTFYPTQEEREELERELERQKAEEMERKAREEERQRIAALKQVYASCRFLFDSEESFETCITNEITVEDEIIELIGKKIDEISEDVKTGKEFRDHNRKSSRDMLCVCKISLPGPSISPYLENKLKEFVSERKALNRKFKKSGSSYYTLFLRYYLQK